MAERDDVFQRLCFEAVQACGPDIAAVERYVASRLMEMNGDDRARVDADLKRVLAFQRPQRPAGRPN